MTRVVITGGSSGLGRAVVHGLLARDYLVTTDGRRPEPLAALRRELASPRLTVLPGDITDPDHRRALVAAAGRPVDLVINNASELGGSPPPELRELSSATFEQLWRTNVDAPWQLVRTALPVLADGAVVVNISSDAAVEHYPGWGGYGATKAALDHLTLTAAAEHPAISWYAVDPGDMRTPMHQAAFPTEDIADRPAPETVVPQLLALLDRRPPSGRYRAAQFAPAGAAA